MNKKTQIALIISLVLNIILLITTTVLLTLYIANKKVIVLGNINVPSKAETKELPQRKGSDVVESGIIDQDALERYSMTYRVAVSSINVRSMPDHTSEKLGVLTENKEVTVTQFMGDWAEIIYREQKGYVKSEFLEKANDTP